MQKATELGVWALWPVEMTRCVARGGKDSRRDRLSRIALEAAKQSGRAHVPQIEPAQAFRQALEALKKDPPDLLLTAWEEERALPMSRAIADFAAHHGRPGRVAVVIGPEGGIAAEEWEALRALGPVRPERIVGRFGRDVIKERKQTHAKDRMLYHAGM